MSKKAPKKAAKKAAKKAPKKAANKPPFVLDRPKWQGPEGHIARGFQDHLPPVVLAAKAAKQWIETPPETRDDKGARKAIRDYLKKGEGTALRAEFRTAYEDLRDGAAHLTESDSLAEARFRSALHALGFEQPKAGSRQPTKPRKAAKKPSGLLTAEQIRSWDNQASGKIGNEWLNSGEKIGILEFIEKNRKRFSAAVRKEQAAQAAKPTKKKPVLVILTAKKAQGAGRILAPHKDRKGARPSLALAPAKERARKLVNVAAIEGQPTPAKLRAELSRQRKALSDRARKFRAWLKLELQKGRERIKRDREETQRKIQALRKAHADERARFQAHAKAERKHLAALVDEGKAARAILAQLDKAQRRQLGELHKKQQRSVKQLAALESARDKRDQQIAGLVREVETHHPELLPFLRSLKMGRSVKRSKGMSLIESFLQLAHDDPGAVAAAMRGNDRTEQKRIAREWAEQGDAFDRAHKRLEWALCQKADRLHQKGKPMVWKRSELAAMAKLGIRPEKVAADCYREHAPWSPDLSFAEWAEAL